MNVLVVAAHHDDIELGCGATVARWAEDGHNVTGYVMTHSGFTAPDGTICRDSGVALKEARRASKLLGYDLIAGDCSTNDIAVTDENVCRILSIVRERKIDTILTHWHGDTHPPHLSVHRLAVHASRTVPRLLGFPVNWHIGSQPFQPSFFVGISKIHFERKMRAFRCFQSEHARSGEKYARHQESLSMMFGLQIGTERAEGFVTYKWLMQ